MRKFYVILIIMCVFAGFFVQTQVCALETNIALGARVSAPYPDPGTGTCMYLEEIVDGDRSSGAYWINFRDVFTDTNNNYLGIHGRNFVEIDLGGIYSVNKINAVIRTYGEYFETARIWGYNDRKLSIEEIVDGGEKFIEIKQKDMTTSLQQIDLYKPKAVRYIYLTGGWDFIGVQEIEVYGEQENTISVEQPAVSQIGDNVINQVDNMLSNVVICDEQIKGPTFNALGYEFCPIKFDAKAVLDLTGLSKRILIDEDKKKVHVILGMKNENNEANVVQTTKMCDASWSKQYKEIKNIYKNANWQRFEQMKGQLNRMGCDMFIKGSMECVAYLDFDYQTGHLKLSEGGIVQKASLGADFNFPIAGPFLYTTLGLTGSERGTIMASINSQGRFEPQMSISPAIKATAKITGNVPVPLLNISLAKAEGGVDAQLGVTLQTMNPNLRVWMNGNLFLNARVGPWTLFDKTYPYLNAELYPNFGANSVAVMSINTDDIYADAYITPRDYLYAASLCSLGTENAIYEQSNVYIDNDAQLLQLAGNSMMLIWTGDDGTKSDVNRTSLMYSVYKNGEWSEIQKIAEDGTATGYFKAVSDGEGVYVVFQKMNEELADDISVEEGLQKIDLYMTKYENEQFSEIINLTAYEDAVYENVTDVKLQDNVLKVAWIENTENEILNNSGKTISKMVEVNDNVLSEVKIIDEYDGAVGESQGDFHIGDDGKVYYIKNVTVNDTTNSKLYFYDGSSSEEFIDATGMFNIEVVNETLYYIKNSSVYKYENGAETALGFDGVDSFKIISKGEHCSMLMSVSDGARNEIYISNLTDGVWSHKERFTDLGQYVRSYSPFMYDDGSISLAVSTAQVNDDVENGESIYGATSMLVLNQCDYCDISTSYVYYDEEEIVPSGDITLYFDVNNDSAKTIESLNVKITNESGEIMDEQRLICDLKAFESDEFSVKYTLPDEIDRTELKIDISIDDEEKDNTNNSVSTEYGYANIVVDDETYTVNKDNTADLSATIYNKGFETAENVTVKICNGSIDGDVLEEFSVGNMKPGSTYSVSYVFPKELMVSPYEDALNAVYVVAETDTEEIQIADNEEKITFNSYAGDYVINSTKTESGKISVNITNNNGDGAKLIVATYSEKGTLVDVSDEDITTEIDYSEEIPVDIKTDEADYASIFVWNSMEKMIPETDKITIFLN